MEGINGERNEQESDRAENHDQNGFYLRRFEVDEVRFCGSFLGRDNMFRKFMEKMVRK